MASNIKAARRLVVSIETYCCGKKKEIPRPPFGNPTIPIDYVVPHSHIHYSLH
jgi:hypothetical protein